MIAPPFTRRRKLVALPNSALFFFRALFLINVIGRVMSVGCGPSLGDHPPIDIFSAHTAYGYIATITILVLRTALDNLARDFVCKRERSSLTNGICLALYRTRLSTLRRIDTE